MTRKWLLESLSRTRKLREYCGTRAARELVTRTRGSESMRIFSKRLGVSTTYISLIESGQTPVSFGVLRRVLEMTKGRK